MHHRAVVARDRLLAREQIVTRLRLLLEDQALQVEPETGLGDRNVPDLAPIPTDRCWRALESCGCSFAALR
jgi:hypothetical protein